MFYDETMDGKTRFSIQAFRADGTMRILYHYDAWQFDFPYSVVCAHDHLYGVSPQGGNVGVGSLFSLSYNGTYKVLHDFSGADGVYPTHLILDESWRFLYGICRAGGGSGGGSIFSYEISTEAFKVLYRFSALDLHPLAPFFITHSEGIIYGFGLRSSDMQTRVFFIFDLDCATLETSEVSSRLLEFARPVNNMTYAFAQTNKTDECRDIVQLTWS